MTTRNPALYRERLWPTPWLFVITALLIPSSLLVFLPINQFVGVIVAIVLYLSSVILLLLASPIVEVTGTELVAGKARLPLALVGAVSAHFGPDARLERGQRLDARAWLLIRGWVDPVVKVHLTDERDPAPYWLVSSRRPSKIVEAIASARADQST